MASLAFYLIMRSGPNPGKSFELTKPEIYIGRDIHNDVVINDAEVSRKHARMTMQAGGYVLEDLGSTNGTFVNGQRLMGPHVLRPNELIMLGENVSLVFETSYDANATAVSIPSQPEQYPSYPPAAAPQSAPQSAQQSAQPMYTPPPRQTTTPQVSTPSVSYAGQVPPGPAEPYYQPLPEEGRSNRTLILAGCGCLVILLCILVAAAFAFDYLNLYCTGPFSALFSCPP